MTILAPKCAKELEEGVYIYVEPVNSAAGYGKASGVSEAFTDTLKSIESLSKQLKAVLAKAGPDETTVEFSQNAILIDCDEDGISGASFNISCSVARPSLALAGSGGKPRSSVTTGV